MALGNLEGPEIAKLSTPRIYYVDGAHGQASARYRVFNALEQLRLVGVEGTLLPQDYDPERAFSSHDGDPGVIVIHRALWDERLSALVEAARAHGIRILYDIDDLVFEPIAMPWVRALSRLSEGELDVYEDEVRRYFRALKSCDGVLTTTHALAYYAEAEGLPTFVHRNGLDQRSVETARAARQARETRAGVVLYYGAGSGTHDVDFQACGRALERLLRKHSSLRLLAQGEVRLGYTLDAFGERVERWPWMPSPDYLTGVAQADINLAPLEVGNPFCEVKSELKWFEAGVMGIPTVASATAAFREVIRTGGNGYLAESHDQWFDILDELVGDAERRQSVGEAAESEALALYQPADMGHQLARLLSLVASANDVAELAKSMEGHASTQARRSGRPMRMPQEGAQYTGVAEATNGERRPLEGLAVDVVCRQEGGMLDALEAGREVAQTFECGEANLTAIAVKAKPQGRRKTCSLEMSLYDDASAPPLQQAQSSLREADNGWVIFRFPAISDSAGRAYRFVVSSPGDESGNACSLYYSEGSLYRRGTLNANGGGSALVFQTFVERRDLGEMRELIRPEQASIVDELMATLNQRDAELGERDAILAERDRTLAEQDALLTEKDAALAQSAADLAEKNALLREKLAALAAEEAAVAQRDQTLHELGKELEAIRHSKGYRLLKGYRAGVRRLFPPGSGSESVYRKVVGTLGKLLDVLSRSRPR